MTMKLRVKRFRTRRPDPVAVSVTPVPPRVSGSKIGDQAFFPGANEDGFGDGPYPTAQGGEAMMLTGAIRPGTRPANASEMPSGTPEGAPMEIDGIRREGLTGRQLRLARRLAQKHGLPATSDFDAVRLLRAQGIDPFRTNSVLELVSSAEAEGEFGAGGSRALTTTPGGQGIQLPQTSSPAALPSPEARAEQSHLSDLHRIQRDIARRRRRKSALLMARLFVFVFLPTLLAGIYYYTIATPLYATKTDFVIQQAEPAAAAGMSSLLRGTQFATSQDSIAVQAYLQSQDAMARLDKDMGFRAHFSDEAIDPIQRLDPNASNAAAYKLYKRNVKIAYDPTEGIVKLEVIAADPAKSVDFAKALLGYAEEQVDQMTQRLREDQMKGARESFADADAKLQEATRRLVDLQEKFKILSSETEAALITTQIGALESQLTQDTLSLTQMQSNASPNAARMEPLKRRIIALQDQITALRSKLTDRSTNGKSLAEVQSELLVAQADAQTRQLLVSQSMQAMETARIEANRQTRYLSVAVSPVQPDEASYPRAFENTLVVMLIFAGIYLMISMTVAILREQISS